LPALLLSLSAQFRPSFLRDVSAVKFCKSTTKRGLLVPGNKLTYVCQLPADCCLHIGQWIRIRLAPMGSHAPGKWVIALRIIFGNRYFIWHFFFIFNTRIAIMNNGFVMGFAWLRINGRDLCTRNSDPNYLIITKIMCRGCHTSYILAMENSNHN